MGLVSQPVLSLLPAEARSVGPSAGLVEGTEGGVVFVFGLATFTYAAGDDIGRRLAAVSLVKTKVATAVEVAAAFGVTMNRPGSPGGLVVTRRPGWASRA